MDPRRRALALLAMDSWDEDEAYLCKLRSWDGFDLLMQTLQDLRVEALYHSCVHGSGHINRVLLFAGLIAADEKLPPDFLAQYLFACCYHDVGRTFDGLDYEHGARSALSLPLLVSQRGEALLEMQAAVWAHSQPDRKMEEMFRHHPARDKTRTRKLACLLKDADNLDRVRLGDLKPEFLRSEAAQALPHFAERLLLRDLSLKKAK